jgi:hypothetical protein
MKHNTYTKIAVFTTAILFMMTSFNSAAFPKNQGTLTPPLPSDIKEGHFLYSPIYGTTTYLINETGVVNHTWPSAYTPNIDSYMLTNGTILYAIAYGNGGFQKIAWDGTIQWEYHYTRDGSYASHDVVPLPNGDVIMIMQEVKSRAQAIQAGRNPGTAGSAFYSDFLIQVHQTGPTSGAIVWEWHIWDHLIQNYDVTKDNYGVVGDHPELIDVNFGEDFTGDWIHMNSVDYNPAYDQILVSAHNFNEVWIIDHSTSTEQAAGHDGGQYGHGGDLLYRWGNPQAYDRGDDSNKILHFQHQVTWIKPGLPGEGDILVFSNGNNRPGGPASTVDEFIPDVGQSGGYYLPPGGTYGPDNLTWQYRLPDNLYSDIWSGAQRMLNGNTIACSGTAGTFIEVTPEKQVVWTYVNPRPYPACPVYRIQYIPPFLPAPKPKLYTIGRLFWTNVAPGAIITGSFQVQNYGDPTSTLNWTVNTSSLSWGTWTATPRSGHDLTPKDGPVTINVTCIAPKDKNKQFRGSLYVKDLNNASDSSSVSIVLDTPYTPPHPFPRLWDWITHLNEAWQEFRHHLLIDRLLIPPKK